MSTPTPARFALGTLCLWVMVAGLFLAGAASFGSLLAYLFAFLAAAAAMILIGSWGEWCVHRLLYHRKSGIPALRAIWELHHQAHHFKNFPPDRYVHPGQVEYVPIFPPRPDRLCETPRERNLTIAIQAGFYALLALVLGVIPAIWLTGNPAFVAGVALTAAVECWLFIRIHDLIHHPSGSWLEKTSAFRFLDHHHFVHHIDTRANVNFLLPLCDALFGTLRTSVTAREQAKWPTWEVARQAGSAS